MSRILVIDDAATVRQYHRGTLESAGYTVDEAMNGLEAIEKVLQSPYDLYLVDVNMPKMDGYSFVRQLRGMQVHQAPAIMVSTESEAHDQTMAYQAGANLYLCKPAKPQALLGYVAMLLGRKTP
ncbi:response regulator transcription factor [Limnobacter sp.]|uniref:response regulator transcription factor n=1 Tax=Limnobacter sp. TaxID=2003368 RepID=UPI003510ECD2